RMPRSASRGRSRTSSLDSDLSSAAKTGRADGDDNHEDREWKRRGPVGAEMTRQCDELLADTENESTNDSPTWRTKLAQQRRSSATQTEQCSAVDGHTVGRRVEQCSYSREQPREGE